MSVVWTDFQGTVGYVRFQIDDPHSMVVLRSSDSTVSLSKRGGWRKLRIPEGKYYWTVSDPGILDDHAANGTVDIESLRTSVIDAEVHRGNALRRSEGYWRCVSTNSVLNGGGVEDRDWATDPVCIAIDQQFILSWDGSGKRLGKWSLKRNADSSPKTLEIIDILTGDSIGEGQWAVSKKKLLLRLYPPRKTTSPYLTSIFSKPTNGDLLEWRFEKLARPPAWLDPEVYGGEIAEPLARNSDDLEPDQPTKSSSGNSDLEGRWILDSVQMGGTPVLPEYGNSELIFVGDWQLTVNSDGTITKGVVTTRTDVSPKRIRIEAKTEEGNSFVELNRFAWRESSGVRWLRVLIGRRFVTDFQVVRACQVVLNFQVVRARTIIRASQVALIGQVVRAVMLC